MDAFTIKIGKKGNVISDIITVIIILFIMAVLIISGKQVMTDLNDDIQDSDDMAQEGKDISSNLSGRYHKIFDTIMLSTLILLWIFIIVASFLIDSHPVFLAITILLLAAVLVVGGFIANAYSEFATDTTMSTHSDFFPITNWIFNNLIMVICAYAVTAIIVMYGKNRVMGSGI